MSLFPDLFHLCGSRLARWPAARRFAALVLGAALLGCGAETGESCWSDEECLSGSCGFGSCDPGVLELIVFVASAFESDPPSPAPEPSPTPYTPVEPPPICRGASEGQCVAQSGCRWAAICFGVRDVPDAGALTCMQAYVQTASCPDDCDLVTSCWR